MLRDALLIAGKDLRLELRSRVTSGQVAPFALLQLVLFGVALDPDRGVLDDATPGLFWIAVLFSSVLAVQRSWAIESADGARDNLRLSALSPGGIFLGKATAVLVELLALELALAVGVVVFYGAELHGVALLVATAIPASAGIAAVGSLYGVLASGLRARETLVPLLVLPVLAPVLIGATRAFEAALDGRSGEGWPWAGLLALFAIGYAAAGVAAYGTLLEES